MATRSLVHRSRFEVGEASPRSTVADSIQFDHWPSGSKSLIPIAICVALRQLVATAWLVTSTCPIRTDFDTGKSRLAKRTPIRPP
jgi:hypothetical protein